MKCLLVILIFLATDGFSQQSGSATLPKPDTASLRICLRSFNKALVSKDTIQLNRLLRDDVHYYHSNGWLQLKREVTGDLYNGKLTYNKVDAIQEGVRYTGNIAQARMTADVDVTMNGKSLQLRLKVVQVWVWKDGRWEMYSRHSERV